MGLWIGLRAWRRSLITGIFTVAGILAAVGTAPSGQAQGDPPEGFRNGTAKAVAVVSRVAPGVGSLALAMEQGIAVSEVTNALAQAQSQAVDSGLIGTALTSEVCGDPKLQHEDLPQPVRADNRQGDSSVSSDELPAGPGAGAGRLEASATRQPSARAAATLVASDIETLISLGGGRSTAESEVIPGEAREARASVEADLIIDGIVELKGMRWSARHRTGTEAVATGTFEIAEAVIGGVPLPLDDLEAAQEALNQTLEVTGITIELPRVERVTEPADVIRVTPMRIAIDNSPLARTLLGPVLDATRDGRVQIHDVLTDAVCEVGPLLWVTDIAMSIVAGTGFLALEVGGVSASSGDLVLTNPFGENESAMKLPPADPAPEGAAAPEVDGPASLPAGTAPPVGGVPQDGALAAPTAAAGPVERLCESIHPFRWPSCSEGAALPLGLLGLGATAAMAALDWRHQRRLARFSRGRRSSGAVTQLPPMRFWRPYLPVLAVGLGFLLMAAVVAPLPRATQVVSGPGQGALGPAGGLASDAAAGEIGAGGPGPGGQPGPGQAGVGGPGPGGQPGPGQAGDPGGGTGGGDGAGSGVRPCPDRAAQVPGDPYSPPCLVFSGDNGGSTHRGVTADEVVISIRELEGPSAAEIFADISGRNVNDSREAFVDTVLALGEYFESRFNFYGRKLRFEFFRGRGVGASELVGGGHEAALSDATRAAREIGAFADLTGLTLPYADALARQGVINIGAPYPSRQWFDERSPYSWSLFPDATVVTEAAVSWIVARLVDQPTAEYAGPSLAGRPRVYGVVAPENAEYQQSVTRFIELVEEAGLEVRLNMRYKLDIPSMPNQASNIIAQLKDAGVTSVMCGCDPVMLAVGLTPKANEQGYEPEWLTGGLAFVEQDFVAQLIETRQWSRAFGIAFNAESEPMGGSFPYAAYKQMRPDDEPAFGVEEIYYQLYILALGIHLAGPDLTPETFQAGLYSYPGGSGPRGHWSFGPGNHTPTGDFRELWWDPNRISPQNNEPGAWVQLGGGARYFPGQVPRGRGAFFEEGR